MLPVPTLESFSCMWVPDMRASPCFFLSLHVSWRSWLASQGRRLPLFCSSFFFQMPQIDVEFPSAQCRNWTWVIVYERFGRWFSRKAYFVDKLEVRFGTQPAPVITHHPHPPSSWSSSQCLSGLSGFLAWLHRVGCRCLSL